MYKSDPAIQPPSSLNSDFMSPWAQRWLNRDPQAMKDANEKVTQNVDKVEINLYFDKFTDKFDTSEGNASESARAMLELINSLMRASASNVLAGGSAE